MRFTEPVGETWSNEPDPIIWFSWHQDEDCIPGDFVYEVDMSWTASPWFVCRTDFMPWTGWCGIGQSGLPDGRYWIDTRACTPPSETTCGTGSAWLRSPVHGLDRAKPTLSLVATTGVDLGSATVARGGFEVTVDVADGLSGVDRVVLNLLGGGTVYEADVAFGAGRHTLTLEGPAADWPLVEVFDKAGNRAFIDLGWVVVV